jgi:hypothetical protein
VTGLPGFLIAMANRPADLTLVGFSVLVAAGGVVLLVSASIALNSPIGVVVGAGMTLHIWIFAEMRLASSAARRPLTGLITEIRLRLQAIKPQTKDRLVAAMAKPDNDTTWHVVTLPTVRSDWARVVLDAAECDDALDQLVGERALCIQLRLTTDRPAPWFTPTAATSRLTAEILLTQYANVVLCTWPGTRSARPRYRAYSGVAVELAAVCRIASDPSVLYTVREPAPRNARTGIRRLRNVHL